MDTHFFSESSWRGSSGSGCQFTGGGTTGRQLTDLMWQCHQTSHLPRQTESMRGEHHWCEWLRCSCSPDPSSPLLAQLHHVPACSNTQSRLQLLMPDLEIHLSKYSLIPSQRSRFTFRVNKPLFAFPPTCRSSHGRLLVLLVHKCCTPAIKTTKKTKPKTMTMLINLLYTPQDESIF